MEAYVRWYQDWADACVYAQECIPDVSFLYPKEPYSALVCIAAMSFAVWWRNERCLKKMRFNESKMREPKEVEVRAVSATPLNAIVEPAKKARSVSQNEAAKPRRM